MLRDRIVNLTDPADVEAFLSDHPTSVVFKAGTCHKTMQGFGFLQEQLEAREDLMVGLIRVVEARAASNLVAERTGIVHHSPQVILFRDGEAVFDVDNWAITPDALVDGFEPGAGGGAVGTAGRATGAATSSPTSTCSSSTSGRDRRAPVRVRLHDDVPRRRVAPLAPGGRGARFDLRRRRPARDDAPDDGREGRDEALRAAPRPPTGSSRSWPPASPPERRSRRRSRSGPAAFVRGGRSARRRSARRKRRRVVALGRSAAARAPRTASLVTVGAAARRRSTAGAAAPRAWRRQQRPHQQGQDEHGAEAEQRQGDQRRHRRIVPVARHGPPSSGAAVRRQRSLRQSATDGRSTLPPLTSTHGRPRAQPHRAVAARSAR
jgi:bacillithiol system protein YtxJ